MVRFAEDKDIDKIQELLKVYKFLLKKAIKEAIAEKLIFVIEQEDEVVGVLIYNRKKK